MPHFGFWTQDDVVIINGRTGGRVTITPDQAIELAKAVLVRYLPPLPEPVDVELPDDRTFNDPLWVPPDETTIEEFDVAPDFEGELHIRRNRPEVNE